MVFSKLGKGKLIGLVALMVIGLFAFAGCGSKPNAENNAQPPAKNNAQAPAQEELSGSITLVGSDSMQNVTAALAEEFQLKNPNVTINVQGGGSGASFEPVRQGIAQFGLVSRGLKDEEKADITAVVVARDGIAIAVNKNNPVSVLTKEQIARIYAGEITNWKEVGGKDAKITVIAREAGSGTTGAFTEIIMDTIDKEIAPSVLRINQSEGIRATVAKSEEAIGYFSLYIADETVKKLNVDGIEATDENVKNGTYKVQRPFNFTYKTEPTGLAKAFLEYTLSDEGQKVIAEEHLITAK